MSGCKNYPEIGGENNLRNLISRLTPKNHPISSLIKVVGTLSVICYSLRKRFVLFLLIAEDEEPIEKRIFQEIVIADNNDNESPLISGK